MVDIWECALGFMDSQALLTAEELGLFDALDEGPRTVDEVAQAMGIPADSADRLLTMLCALQVVRKTADDRYENGPEAAEKLVRGKPGYIGDMFVHVRDDLYPAWGRCRDALVGRGAAGDGDGAPAEPPSEGVFGDPEALRAFLDGMHAITYKSAVEFAGYPPEELREARTLVDVGGASGAFLIAMAQAFPELRGTVFDLPPVQPFAEDRIRRAGLDDRLGFHAGDFWNDSLPAGADAYALGFILHDWDDDAGSTILGKVAEACPPGGCLIVGEYLLNDDRTGPLHVARQNLNMQVAARGRERSAPEYIDWFRRFGFETERIYRTSNGKNFLVARKDGEG